MNGSNIIEAIQLFLMDIFVFLIPGATSSITIWIILYSNNSKYDFGFISLPPSTAFQWIIAIILVYILGYVLQGIGETWVTNVSESIAARRTTLF
jgi:hypothetical protein